MSNVSPRIDIVQSTKWTNYHATISMDVNRFVNIWNAEPEESDVQSYNKTTRALQKLLEGAITDDREIRALGGGWSWTGVAATPDRMVNTRPLNFRFQVSPEHLHLSERANCDNLFFLQCGTSIADLNRYLQPKNKCLKTSGASNGQTIVGAMSTGTHGSAFDVGAIQDYVRAIHLIVSPTRSVWLEPESSPVTEDSVGTMFEADIVRSDDLFRSALVSFGNFGLIGGVLIEAVDRYYLQIYWERCPIDNGLWHTIEHLDFDSGYLSSVFPMVNLPGNGRQRPFHFEVLIDPYDRGDHAHVKVMYQNNDPWPGQKLSSAGRFHPGDSLAEVAGKITDLVPFATPHLMSFALKQEFKPLHGVSGEPGEVFTDTTTRGRTASSAIGLPLASMKHVAQEAIQLIREVGAPAFVAMRFVKCSNAHLAFTRFREQTGVLEFDGPRSDRMTEFYNRLWTKLDKDCVKHTFHWGKLSNISAANVRRCFGCENVDAWRKSRDTLLNTPQLQKVFSNKHLYDLGLSK